MTDLLLLPIKTALVIASTIITLAGAVTVLDLMGLTQGQAQNILQFPGNLNELIDLGISALRRNCGG